MRRVLLGSILLLVPLLTIPGVFLFYDVTPKVVILPGTAAGLARMAAQCVSLIVSTVFSVAPELSLAGANWRRFGLLM